MSKRFILVTRVVMLMLSLSVKSASDRVYNAFLTPARKFSNSKHSLEYLRREESTRKSSLEPVFRHQIVSGIVQPIINS